MTYCVAMCVDEGLVFLSDTRTNAGVDHISTARKMSVFEQPGERVLVLLAAGNLSLTQGRAARAFRTVGSAGPYALERADDGRCRACGRPRGARRSSARSGRAARLRRRLQLQLHSGWTNCAGHVGRAGASSAEQDGAAPIPRPRLYMIYAAGNFIEASSVNPYFQIGESKYGKPIIDRVLVPQTPARRSRQMRAGLDGLDVALESVGRFAARSAGVRKGRAARDAFRDRYARQYVLPDDSPHVGRAAAPGVQRDSGPPTGTIRPRFRATRWKERWCCTTRRLLLRTAPSKHGRHRR